MKRIGILLLAAVALLGCNKALTQANIEGSWSEQYDPTVFAMDGSVTRPLKKDPFFEASKNRIFTITLLSFHMHLKNGFSGG